MAVWSRVGRGAWAAARGGRKLQDAAERAEAGGGAGVDEAPPVESTLTVQEGVLLVRYLAARGLLTWLETFFLVKYLFLVLAAVVWWLTEEPILAGALVVIFLVLAAVQWVITRKIGRFGSFDELSALDGIAGDATTVWWPNLRRELRRVGLQSSPLGLARLGKGAVTRSLSPEQQAAYEQIDWFAVAPRNQWRLARRALADAAAARGG